MPLIVVSKFRQLSRVAAAFAFAAFAAIAPSAFAQQADLVVNQLDSPDPGPAGGVFTYTVRVDNNGPNAAIGVSFADTLPPGSTFIGATPTQGSCGAPVAGVLTCALGDLAYLANATVTIQVRLPTSGIWTNTASATSTTADPNTSNNLNVAEQTTALNAADMSVTVTDAPDPVAAGAPYNYTVTARNNGPNALGATDTQTVTFPVPAGACIRSTPTGTAWTCTGSGAFPLCSGTVSCTRTGALAVNTNAGAITVPAVANVTGAITGTFTTGSSLPDGNPANNTASATTTVTGGSDVQITKTAAPATVTVGSNVTYTLTPRFNGGEQPGTASPNVITITDTLAAGLTFVSATPVSGWTCNFSAPTLTCTLPGPYAGAPFTIMPAITVVATVNATGAIANTAVIAAPEADPVPANNTSTVSVTGSNTADMQIVKGASINPVLPNQNFNYTLAVTNLGPATLPVGEVITVTDTLPLGISLRALPSGGGFACTTVPATAFPIAGPVAITCTRSTPALAINSTQTITVAAVATVAAATINTACVALTGAGPTDPVAGNNCSNVTVTSSTTSANLGITKTASPNPVLYGQPLTYTITVSNAGPNDATNVVVTDTLAALVTPGGITAITPSQGTCTPALPVVGASQTLNCNFGTINNGATANVVVTILPTIAATGNRANTATVNSLDVGDTNRANNTVTINSTVQALVDVVTSKTAVPSPVQAGTPLTYTLTARNNGPSNASAVVATDTLPANATFVSMGTISGGGSCTFPAAGTLGGTVQCTWATINSGAQQTAIFVVRPQTGVASVQNDIAIATSSTESNSGNNTFSLTTPVTNALVDLLINKSDSLDPVAIGQSTTYTVKVSNNGPSFATNVVMTDTFPTGSPTATFSYQGALTITPPGSGACVQPAVNATAGTLTCTFPGIASGSFVTVTYDMRAESIAAGISGTTFNSATVTAAEPETQLGNNTSLEATTARRSADLALTKSAPATVVPGTQFDFTLNVTNNGPFTSVGAIVTDTLPAGVSFVSASPGCAFATGTVTCTLGTLAVNASTSLTITALVSDPYAGANPLLNSATVTTVNEIDIVTGNNTGNSSSTVNPSADLSITKSDGVTAVVAGSTVTYTITASNAGPSGVTGATVADTLPGTLLSPTWTCSGTGGGTCPAASGSGNLNALVNLPKNATVTFVVTAPLSPAATGTLSNTATVTAPVGTTDPNPGNNSATDADTITSTADLSITKNDGVTTINAGAQVVYTIVASNAGPSTATGATVADTLPASLTGATWTCVGAGGGTCPASGSGNLNATVNLPAGGSVTFTVTATLSPAATGSLTNTATITPPGGTTDPTPGNNSATDTDTIASQADLSITKTDGATTVTPGNTVVYTIVASNAGPSNVTGATVADTLPATLTGATWTCSGAGGGTCPASGGGNINATVNLPAGGSVTFLVTATLSPSATGTLSNTATVTPPGGVNDPTPGNNSATDTDTINPSADLSITKTDGATTVTPGNSVVYTIVASNAGPSDVTGATVADTLPASLTGATWTCSGAGGGTCPASGSGNINATVNLPASGSVTFLVTATLSPSATGTLSNTATVTPPGGVNDPTPGNNSATDTDTINPSADLSITKTDGQTTVIAGSTVTYTITASNAGPSAVTGATVADTLPATLTGATWTCSGTGGGTCPASGSGNLNATVNLPASGSVTFIVTATLSPSATGTLSNTATVTPPGGVNDPTPGNNSATDTDTIAAQADLSITKTDGVTTAVPGDPLTYTIVATNNGPSAVTGATVADTLPATLTGATWTCVGNGGGTCPANGSGDINALVDLPVGGAVTFTLTATLASSATGTLSNTATVATPVGVTDPTPGNNSATDTDTLTPQVTLEVTKTDGASTYTPGGTATYTVTIENTGASDATSVAVTDTLPAGVTLAATVTCAANGTSTCGTVTGAAGAGAFSVAAARVNAGGANTLVLTVPVNFAPGLSTPSLANTATATDGPTGATGSDTDTDALSANVTLAVTKDDGSATYTPGGTATYTVTVANTGISDALAVNVSDTLPTGVTLNGTVTCTPNGTSGCGAVNGVAGAGSFSATAARVNAGAANSLVFQVPVKFAAGMTTDPVLNTATAIDVPTGNTASGDDSDALSLDVSLEVDKTDGSTTYTPGGTATYTITVANTGVSDALDVTVSDSLPPGVTLTALATCVANGTSSCGTVSGAAGGSTLGANNARVNAGGGNSLVFTAPVAFAAGMTINPLVNQATASDLPSGITANDSDSDTLSASVTLAVTKTDNSPTYTPGGTATYTITVGNTGVTDALNVTVADTLPAGVTLTGAATCSAAGTSSCGTVTGAAGSGTLGATGAVVRAGGASGALTFTAPVKFAANLLTDPLDNTATATDQPTGASASGKDSDTLAAQITLAVTKDDGVAAYTPGGTGTYVVTVANNGISDATDVTVSDPLPSGMTLTGTVTCVAAGTAACGTVTGAAGGTSFGATGAKLPAGGGNVLTFTVPVAFGAGMSANPVSNTATATDVPTGISTSATDSDARASQVTLAVVKTDGSATYVPGATATYTITVTNTGTSDALNVTLTDALPAGVTLTGNATCSAAGASSCGTVTGTTGGAALGTTGAIVRAGGAANALTFTAPVLFAASLVTSPLVNSATATDVASGASATGSDSDTRNGALALGITKTDNSPTYTPGGTGVYVITVVNAGPAPATALIVSDPLPPGVALTGTPACVATGAATCGVISGAAGDGSFTATGATLAAGGANKLVYTLPVRFDVALSVSPLTNIATVKEGAGGVVSSASDTNTNIRGNGPGGAVEIPALGDALLALLALLLLAGGMRRAALAKVRRDR